MLILCLFFVSVGYCEKESYVLLSNNGGKGQDFGLRYIYPFDKPTNPPDRLQDKEGTFGNRLFKRIEVQYPEYQIKHPDGIFYTGLKEVDDALLRDLLGIHPDVKIYNVEKGKKRQLGKDEKIKLTKDQPLTISWDKF